MIGSDDKMTGVAADGDSMNQIHDFLNGFLTRMKHLILSVCLVSARVNLIMTTSEPTLLQAGLL